MAKKSQPAKAAKPKTESPKKESPAARKRSPRGQGDVSRIDSVVTAILEGRLGSAKDGVKAELNLNGTPRSAWWNWLWYHRQRQTPTYAAMVYRGMPLVEESGKVFLIWSGEQVAEMRKEYKKAKKS
jgi:hypothetical protein